MCLNNLTVSSLSMKCHWIFKLRYLSKNRFSEYPFKRKASRCERIPIYLLKNMKDYAFTPVFSDCDVSILVGNRLFMQTLPTLYSMQFWTSLARRTTAGDTWGRESQIKTVACALLLVSQRKIGQMLKNIFLTFVL